MKRQASLCALLGLICAGGVALSQESKPQENKPTAEKLAPYYPTPPVVVEQMLQLGGVKPGAKLFDLGSGDGRIVIMAAQKFQADATGVELDAQLVKESREKIHSLGLDEKAHIIQGDLLQQDYSGADVLTVYLLPSANEKLKPILERQLKDGTRVVAHDFLFKGWTAEQEKYLEDDGEGRSHTLYLYVIHKEPAK